MLDVLVVAVDVAGIHLVGIHLVVVAVDVFGIWVWLVQVVRDVAIETCHLLHRASLFVGHRVLDVTQSVA